MILGIKIGIGIIIGLGIGVIALWIIGIILDLIISGITGKSLWDHLTGK